MLQTNAAAHTKELNSPNLFWGVWYRRCYLDQLLTHDKLKMQAGKLKISKKEGFCTVLWTLLQCYGTENSTV